MTYLTFANFFTFIYGWIGLWTMLTFIMMMTRHGKNWSDYDVAFFRGAVSVVTISVFLNRVLSQDARPAEPVMTPFLVLMIICHVILAYASAATFVRVIYNLIGKYDERDAYYFIPDNPESPVGNVEEGSERPSIAPDVIGVRGLLVSGSGVVRESRSGDRRIVFKRR